MSLEEQRDALWVEFRRVIAGHIEPGHDEIDTINRLLRKNPWLKERGESLQVPRDGIAIAVESWELPDLWALIHGSLVTEQPPAMAKGAVLVLRWRNGPLLIDGRRRINHWYRERQQGPHRVLTVSNANDI